MAGASRTLTIKFVGDSKNVQRSVKDLTSAMDDTESAGKRVAKAIGILSDDAETGFRDAKEAADKLARALGEDTVAEIKAAGRSVEGYVQDLKGMGLTYDDVRTDVDELADAIRKIETTKASLDTAKRGTMDLGDEAKIAAGKIDTVRDSGDQSRSVLANMVGNSAQDLGALGGVAGTAGMAIGQMAEYATEGNINLQGLAKVAGPMAGVTAAVIGVTWAVGKFKEDAEAARRETELWVEVTGQLGEGDIKGAVAGIEEQYRDVIGALEDLGYESGEFVTAARGQGELVGDLSSRYEELSEKIGPSLDGMARLTQAERDEYHALSDLIPTLQGVVENRQNGIETYDDTQRRTQELTRALEDERVAFETVDRSAEDFVDEMQRAERATKELDDAYLKLTGKLTAEDEWLGLQENLRQFTWDMASGTLSTDEQRQALVDMQLELVDYVAGLEGVPPSKQTEILALIDQGKIVEAETAINNLSRSREVQLSFLLAGGGGAGGLKYSAGGNPLGAGEPSVVGDNPDGSWNSTTELFVPSVSGRILSASDSRAAVGGGGTTIVNVNVSATPLATPADIGRAVREYLLVDARTSGPVFQTVRS